MSAAPAVNAQGPLAIICGGGSLPVAVADSVSASGRGVLLFPLRGAADPQAVARHPHHWLYVGQGGKFRRLARAAGCTDVVLIGSMVRPALRHIRPDFTTLFYLPRIITAYRGGDDHLLSSIARIFDEHGFHLVGAHEVAPEILMPAGPLGEALPSAADRADIALGLEYLRAAAPFDIGQAVVVAGRHVLAVEAAEGTDAMLARVADMRGKKRVPPAAGVLVKAPKHGQDHRFDLPSIGPQTVEAAARAGLSGIAVVAGSTIVAEAEALIAAASRARLFVIGVAAETRQ